MSMFIGDSALQQCTWQAFERMVYRLLLCEGFSGVRAVGQSGDGGADVIAHKASKRWLFRSSGLGQERYNVIDRTLQALQTYKAQVPVVVTVKGFTEEARQHQQVLMSENVPLRLWDRTRLLQRAQALPLTPLVDTVPGRFVQRDYQEQAIRAIVQSYRDGLTRRALVVMATGLGKTAVAAEAIRRLGATAPPRVLVIAHTNELVYQLDRAFWPFLRPDQETLSGMASSIPLLRRSHAQHLSSPAYRPWPNTSSRATSRLRSTFCLLMSAITQAPKCIKASWTRCELARMAGLISWDLRRLHGGRTSQVQKRTSASRSYRSRGPIAG